MDEPGDYYTKWTKSNGEKKYIWYCLYVESEKGNAQNRDRLIKMNLWLPGGKARREG